MAAYLYTQINNQAGLSNMKICITALLAFSFLAVYPQGEGRVFSAKTGYSMDAKKLQEGPSFPGGIDSLHIFISQNINNTLIRNERPEGTIIISFDIDMKGEAKKFSIVNSEVHNPRIESECIRVLSLMPKWLSPGSEDLPLTYTIYYPFVFSPE
jgi:hypothetical protein